MYWIVGVGESGQVIVIVFGWVWCVEVFSVVGVQCDLVGWGLFYVQFWCGFVFVVFVFVVVDCSVQF